MGTFKVIKGRILFPSNPTLIMEPSTIAILSLGVGTCDMDAFHSKTEGTNQCIEQ